MNITDVGHLTGDMDMGEDKLEKRAKTENKTAWEIAEFYTKAFKNDIKKLNIISPNIWSKATEKENIKKQIELIHSLENKGFTYKTSDGIYFDTSKFPDYNKLSHLKLDELKEGARVEKNEEKKNPTDFALWKFSPKDEKRQMEWDSPWGIGFPGWHIECSAISMRHLGSQLDIHCGGIDHVNIHHTNEIAQSEAATGKQFFEFWMHGAFLNIQGGKKMAKSKGNFLTIKNALEDKNINPLAYRFASLQTHYRKPMEYSEESIENTERGLNNLYSQIIDLGEESGDINKEFQKIFLEAINNDLNMPNALAVAQKLLKSDLQDKDKLATILDFDKVLGLGFADLKKQEIPIEIIELAKKRKKARNEKDWDLSDKLRDEILEKGYVVEDLKNNEFKIKNKL
jgi:cysteinyl-tRNA synthetase